MVQSHQIDTHAPEAFGNPDGIAVVGIGKVGAKSEAHAEESHSPVVAGIGLQVGSDRVEMAVSHKYPVRRGQWSVKKTEIWRAAEMVLIDGKSVVVRSGLGLSATRRRAKPYCQ